MAKQPQLEAFSKIAAMLETVIFNGSTGGSDREFYTIPHPGIFIDPKLTDRPNSKDMELISELFNGCFNATLLYNPIPTTVTQTYSDILDQAALPEKVLTSPEKKRLKDLEDGLERMIDAYLKYKQRYDDVKGEIIRAQVNNEAADVIAKLQAKLQTALSEWKLRGKKDLFEQSEAEVAYLRSVSPRQHFQKLKSRFDQHTQTSGVSSYQATYLSPPIQEWASPYAGWAQFEKTFKYSELHTYSKHTSWSGSASANFGVWKIGGGASGSSTDIHEASENTDIELKFEFLRVRVLRPWLVPDVLRYRFWTYKSAFGYRLVSEGYTPGTTTPIGPNGLMPVLPTDIIVARNVTISASFSDSERKFAQDTISGSVGGGWGPFRAKGSYQSTTTKEDVVGSFDGTTLRIANPQIIGMMGILLPKTPDPDRRLPWGTDADFGDASTKAKIALANNGVLSSADYDKLAQEQANILAGLQWRDR
ncbi:hypothetical protein ACI6PO_10590 [Agrobacterium tumefaciens]